MPRPSKRTKSDSKKNFHDKGPVHCILYIVLDTQEKALQEGSVTSAATGARIDQHAERVWWTENRDEYIKQVKQDQLIRLEFELTKDFCGDECRNQFVQARTLARAYGKAQIPIYIFIMRTKQYYVVQTDDAGSVDGPYDWD